MARARTTPNPAAQFETRGYIIDEDSDWALRDVASGLSAIAALAVARDIALAELSGAQWGGLLRTFSRQVQSITNEAAFTNQATARKRDDV